MRFVCFRVLRLEFEADALPGGKRIFDLQPGTGTQFELLVCEQAVVEELGDGLLVDAGADDDDFLSPVAKGLDKVLQNALDLRLLQELGVRLESHFEPVVGVEPRPAALDAVEEAGVVPLCDAVVSRGDPRVALAPHDPFDALFQTLVEPLRMERLAALVDERGDAVVVSVVVSVPGAMAMAVAVAMVSTILFFCTLLHGHDRGRHVRVRGRVRARVPLSCRILSLFCRPHL
mmetsp:Transcript_160/g.250  ORF Transcript_160/g.250 Transcript_160/m.250 type:complete len:232 (+) Transcript_160:358-1053(+)